MLLVKRGSKYDPLRHYLLRQTLREFVLSFSEIETIIQAPLPKYAERPQFWANTKLTGTHVQREAWRQAGYDAFVRPNKASVKFVKVTV